MFTSIVHTIYILFIHIIGFMILLKWHRHQTEVTVIKEEEEEIEGILKMEEEDEFNVDPNGVEPLEENWYYHRIHLREIGDLAQDHSRAAEALFLALGCPPDQAEHNAKQITNESVRTIRGLRSYAKIYLGFTEFKITDQILGKTVEIYKRFCMEDGLTERIRFWGEDVVTEEDEGLVNRDY
jgi:hypothetical protein